MPLRVGWIREQAAFLLVLLVLLGSFCYLIAAPEHPIRGALGIALAALLAAALRLVLPGGAVGLLAVRGRVVDIVIYVVLGALIVASSIRLKQ